ncbi:MAG: PrgI family mobile element protein [Candidatus Roizmanbacteria bacterium]
MENHSIPRSITTFEFKLIGFLSIKQFLYLLLFSSLGYLVYLLLAIPVVNIILGILISLIGVALAFIKYNERGLDVHMKNLYRRLTTPSQYYYKKGLSPPSFAKIPHIMSNQRVTLLHSDANEKLKKYADKQNPPIERNYQSLPVPDLYPPDDFNLTEEISSEIPDEVPSTNDLPQPESRVETMKPENPLPMSPKTNIPILSGIISSKRGFSLPNVMVYIKDTSGKVLRILKTDPSGKFATFHPLEVGSYIIEPRDPSAKHFFDTMNILVGPAVSTDPIMITSKEIL